MVGDSTMKSVSDFYGEDGCVHYDPVCCDFCLVICVLRSSKRRVVFVHASLVIDEVWIFV